MSGELIVKYDKDYLQMDFPAETLLARNYPIIFGESQV